jgi:hypothetical protein
MVCVGSGQQRYKFKEEHGFLRASNKRHISELFSKPGKDDEVIGILFACPSNDLTSLAHAFVYTMKASTDLKYNLSWAYGGFLEDVPRRLGTNEALDTSADALVTAHSSFCAHRTVSVAALTKYSRALNMLRIYLDDPVKACTSDTLCAVALLLICQVSTRFCKKILHY